MMNESVKKSLEKSKNVLEEKRKIVKRQFCIKKTHTFTIIGINFVQEQLKTENHKASSTLKKDRAPIQSNSWIVKNKRRPIIATAIAVRLLKMTNQFMNQY